MVGKMEGERNMIRTHQFHRLYLMLVVVLLFLVAHSSLIDN